MSKLLLVVTNSVRGRNKEGRFGRQKLNLLGVISPMFYIKRFEGIASPVLVDKRVRFIRPWPRYISRTWPISRAFIVAQVLLGLCLWFHEARAALFMVSFTIGFFCAIG